MRPGSHDQVISVGSGVRRDADGRIGRDGHRRQRTDPSILLIHDRNTADSLTRFVAVGQEFPRPYREYIELVVLDSARILATEATE